VDFIFILVVVAHYAVTQWLGAAISRL